MALKDIIKYASIFTFLLNPNISQGADSTQLQINPPLYSTLLPDKQNEISVGPLGKGESLSISGYGVSGAKFEGNTLKVITSQFILPNYTLDIILKPNKSNEETKLTFQTSGYRFVDQKDSDKDGLPDSLEALIGSCPYNKDSDGDGLEDYLEFCKYKTDPTKKDSDGDGIPDSDWEERREFTYTIAAKMMLLEPFDIETMNDQFQDVRKIGGKDKDGYQLIQIIIYPESDPLFVPSTDKKLDRSMRKYLNKTAEMNYSKETKGEIGKLTESQPTNIGKICKILEWLNGTKTVTKHAEFMHVAIKDGKIEVRSPFDDPNYSDEEILEKCFIGEKMYRMKEHGTCGSSSILRGMLLRAVGIPTRVAQSVPLLYDIAGEEISGEITNEKYNKALRVQEGRSDIWNHLYNESYVNHHWMRVDYTADQTALAYKMLFVKIISFGSFQDTDFTDTWKDETWLKRRPYKTLEVDEQFPKHKK